MFWRGKYMSTSGLENSHDLLDPLSRIKDVLQNVLGDKNIKMMIRECQVLYILAPDTVDDLTILHTVKKVRIAVAIAEPSHIVMRRRRLVNRQLLPTGELLIQYVIQCPVSRYRATPRTHVLVPQPWSEYYKRRFTAAAGTISNGRPIGYLSTKGRLPDGQQPETKPLEPYKCSYHYHHHIEQRPRTEKLLNRPHPVTTNVFHGVVRIRVTGCCRLAMMRSIRF